MVIQLGNIARGNLWWTCFFPIKKPEGKLFFLGRHFVPPRQLGTGSHCTKLLEPILPVIFRNYFAVTEKGVKGENECHGNIAWLRAHPAAAGFAQITLRLQCSLRSHFVGSPRFAGFAYPQKFSLKGKGELFIVLRVLASTRKNKKYFLWWRHHSVVIFSISSKLLPSFIFYLQLSASWSVRHQLVPDGVATKEERLGMAKMGEIGHPSVVY